jgi:hypothetical protein
MAFAPKTYADAAELKATLSLDGTNYADADLSQAIIAASRYIDDQTHRRFWLDDTDNARYFTATDPTVVVIDDAATITTIATDEAGDGSYSAIWTPAEWEPNPRNHEADGKPVMMLVRAESTPTGRTFPIARSAVKVTGLFGWLTVPQEIVTATEIMASRIMRRLREAPFGIVAIGMDGTPIRVGKSDPEIDGLLRGFKRAQAGHAGAALFV